MSDASKDVVCGCGALACRVIMAPVCHGLSDGPGSKVQSFLKSDLYEETKQQMKQMEDAGRLRDPKKMKAALGIVERMKNRNDTKINYEKGGHPLDGVERD